MTDIDPNWPAVFSVDLPSLVIISLAIIAACVILGIHSGRAIARQSRRIEEERFL